MWFVLIFFKHYFILVTINKNRVGETNIILKVFSLTYAIAKYKLYLC